MGLAQGWRKAELPPIEAYLSPGTRSLVCRKVVLAVVFALLEDVLPCGSGAAPSLSFPGRCEAPSGHFLITCYVWPCVTELVVGFGNLVAGITER